MLPKASAYVKSYDGQTKWMYFFIKEDDLLQKYNTISDYVTADIKNKFDSESVYNNELLKTKIKCHGDEVTDFYDKKIPKVEISSDFALKKNHNYYLQVFLKECKCIEKKVIRHINDNLSDFSSYDESDEE